MQNDHADTPDVGVSAWWFCKIDAVGGAPVRCAPPVVPHGPVELALAAGRSLRGRPAVRQP